jgi:hypothetical protein
MASSKRPSIKPKCGASLGRRDRQARPTVGDRSGAKVTLRRLVRSERLLQVILAVTVAANLGSGGLSGVALPALARNELHTGAAGYGALLAAFQRWAPPALLGRLMGLLLLASFGIFPLSVLLGGLVVHTLGAPTYFPLGSAVLAVAVLAGLTQPTWRTFGTDRYKDRAEPET